MVEPEQPGRIVVERTSDLIDHRVEAAVTEMRTQLREQINGAKELSAERWMAHRALLVAKDTELERRLLALAHELDRLETAAGGYVRAELYREDAKRLYDEKQTQNQNATQARIQAEATASTARRNTSLAMTGFAVSVATVLISTLLHFFPGGH